MSWNNVLPWWVLESERDQREALSLCAFPEEWKSGTSVNLPNNLILMDKATFSSWDKGGWNCPWTTEDLKISSKD